MDPLEGSKDTRILRKDSGGREFTMIYFNEQRNIIKKISMNNIVF